jgi:ATP-binding cassette subfamily B protein
MQETAPVPDTSVYQKISFKEFVNISKWVLSLVFSLEPVASSTYLVVTVIHNLRPIFNAYILGRVIDALIKTAQVEGATMKELYPLISVLFGFNFLMVLLSYVGGYFSNYLRNACRPKLSKAFYTQLSYLGVQTLEQPNINNRVHRADNYINSLSDYLKQVIQIISDVVNSVGSLLIIFGFYPVLVPAIVLSLVPYVLYDKKYRGMLYKFDFDNTEDARKAGWSALGLRDPRDLLEISITNAFRFFDKKYMQFQEWALRKRMLIIQQWNSGNYICGIFGDIFLFMGYIKVFAGLLARTISVGRVTYYIQTLGFFQGSMKNILRGLNDLNEFSIQIRDVYYLFNIQPMVEDGKTPMDYLKSGPEVVFKNVSFRYPNAQSLVLKNFNLHIEAGEKLAIVGHNGAGKTTLVKLISRIYKVSNGEVTVAGVNVNDFKIKTLYRNMGILWQDYNTYGHLTARENIILGRSDEPVDEKAVVSAAKAADAFDFIEEFPDKFDQILSERFKGGTRPSTGQWQKIAIARFFYRNAPLVIFDEPTASIDAVSEYNIFNKIYKFFKGKTVILISHRFSTVRNADRIIYLEKGKIIEEGSHKKLMELDGKYAHAFELQAEGYAPEIADE